GLVLPARLTLARPDAMRTNPEFSLAASVSPHNPLIAHRAGCRGLRTRHFWLVWRAQERKKKRLVGCKVVWCERKKKTGQGSNGGVCRAVATRWRGGRADVECDRAEIFWRLVRGGAAHDARVPTHAAHPAVRARR